jgi:two-component system, NtrC family, sensor kinase
MTVPRKRFHVPIFWKISLAIVIVVALFGSVNVYVIRQWITKTVMEQAVFRATTQARALAELLQNDLPSDDLTEVREHLMDVLRIDSTAHYALLLGADGHVISHTFDLGVPGALQQAIVESDTTILLHRTAAGERLVDIAAPVLDGRLGDVHVGISLTSVDRLSNLLLQTFLLMIAAFLAVGLGGALLFARYVTDPVKRIAETASSIRLDELGQGRPPRVTIRTMFTRVFSSVPRVADEMDTLADRFNEMVARLDRAYGELTTAQAMALRSEKLATIGILAAGIAHEVNNPVAGIRNCVRRMQEDPDDQEQFQRYLSLMDHASEHIARVVSGLLQFSRTQDHPYAPVSLGAVVERAIALVAHRLKQSDIKITTRLAEGTPMVMGNAGELEQVVVNLLVNALHATEDGRLGEGDPLLSPSGIFVGVREEGGNIVLNIEDQGIGISDDDLQHVFDPFFTTKDSEHGTGLGLAVCRKIVQQHGGMISLDNSGARGATATVSFPRMKAVS